MFLVFHWISFTQTLSDQVIYNCKYLWMNKCWLVKSEYWSKQWNFSNLCCYCVSSRIIISIEFWPQPMEIRLIKPFVLFPHKILLHNFLLMVCQAYFYMPHSTVLFTSFPLGWPCYLPFYCFCMLRWTQRNKKLSGFVRFSPKQGISVPVSWTGTVCFPLISAQHLILATSVLHFLLLFERHNGIYFYFYGDYQCLWCCLPWCMLGYYRHCRYYRQHVGKPRCPPGNNCCFNHCSIPPLGSPLYSLQSWWFFPWGLSNCLSLWRWDLRSRPGIVSNERLLIGVIFMKFM